MDPRFLKKIEQRRGAFTQELVDGWHKQDMSRIVSHLDKCYRSIFKPLESKGYYYDGIERTCPLEFYRDSTTPRKDKNSDSKKTGSSKEFEISKCSFFGVRVLNHFVNPKTGVRSELNNPLTYLAYTNTHGDVHVRNSIYSLQYVLSERGPSVDGDVDKTIFIRVLGYKFKVTKEVHTFHRVFKTGYNVNTTALNMTLPASRFYNPRNGRKINSNKVPIPLLAWYVFGKYGFTKSMNEYAECDFVIDNMNTLLEICPESEGWEIYANTGGIHPKAFSRPKGTPILEEPAIAVKSRNKGGEVSNLALQYVAGALFMFGVFSHELDIRRLDDIDYWRLVIGRCSIRLTTKNPNAEYLRQMSEHFSSVEEYADDITIEKYNKFDIDVKTTYELFNYLMLNYSSLIKLYNPADMLHKELACMDFIIDHLIRRANDFKYKIKNGPSTTEAIINTKLSEFFGISNIDKSVRENNSILELTGTDNPFIDYGTGIILQTKSTVNQGGGKGKEEFNPNHPGSMIDASQPFVCSYQYSTKPHPDGRGSLQPRVHLEQGRYISLRPEDRLLYEATKQRLKERESFVPNPVTLEGKVTKKTIE